MPAPDHADLQVARGEPDRAGIGLRPTLKVIQELGLRHETVYLAHLAAQDSRSRSGTVEYREEQRLIQRRSR